MIAKKPISFNGGLSVLSKLLPTVLAVIGLIGFAITLQNYVCSINKEQGELKEQLRAYEEKVDKKLTIIDEKINKLQTDLAVVISRLEGKLDKK